MPSGKLDITHIPEFGCSKHVHVTVDFFFPHMIAASARRGKITSDAISHLLCTLSFLGLPLRLKVDNGPAYTRKCFKEFCNFLIIL